jgi:beta-glucosidase
MEYLSHGGSVVHLNWLTAPLHAGETFAREVDAARNSDLVVAFLGFGTDSGMEGKDRDNLDLAIDQQQLIREIVAANPNTIVVFINGGPLAVEWIANHVPALVDAWYPGEQGGSALASLLFGEMNPAGRLPLTFYRSTDQLTSFKDYEISHGKTYQFFTGKPLYPFGYGLSYTNFTYSHLRLTPGTTKTGKAVVAHFDITNTGSRDGDEVAQLYFHVIAPAKGEPIHQLGAFRRVAVRSGATVAVSLPLMVESLRVYNPVKKHFMLLSRKIAVEVGSSAADIRLSDTVALTTKP